MASESRVAFITGGTSGIGRASAERLASSGWRVAIIGRRETEITPPSAGEIMAIRADVCDEAALLGALAQTEAAFGKIDLIFNNAGMDNTGPFIEEHDAAAFRALLELNLIAPYNGMRHGPKHMSDGGCILNTASIAATTHLPGYAQYSASKAAIIALTKTAAIEFAPRHIRVNAICPGSIWSEMLLPDNPETDLVKIAAPEGRVGEASEVAALVEFLAGPDAAYINGQAINIDGGVTSGFSLALIEKLLS